MGNYIVKVDPSEDFYVVWSDNTGSPHYWGHRDELRLEMSERAGPELERFDRADRMGTSALWPSASDPYLGWNDSGMVYHEKGFLPRSSLKELCLRLQRDAQADVSDLLQPFDN